MKEMFLSLIIPAYNEQNRLPTTLFKIDEFLNQQTYSAEVLIVENGSTDQTKEVAIHEQRKYPYIRLISVSQKGKGIAVKVGMLEAQGQFRFFWMLTFLCL